MQAGTLLATLAILPQMVAVIKNRDCLKGYDPLASFALSFAVILFTCGFIMMENWFSVLCEIPSIIFWFIAGIYSYKNKRNEQLK